jgi:hypothetical protein
VAGIVINPRGPWSEVFESAAAGTCAIAALLVLTAIGVLIAHPANEHGDQEAGVQVVFIGLLAIPLYVPCLLGAVAGKLLGRVARRPK